MNEGVLQYVKMQRDTIYDTHDKPLEYYQNYVTCEGDPAFDQAISDACYSSHWPHSSQRLANCGNVALDVGCGVGRLIVGWHKYFRQIDGVDLSQRMLKRCRQYMDRNGIGGKLMHCNGYNLDCIPGNEIYNVIYSELVFEHIAVWDIRRSYLEDFFRLLKPGGEISILTKGSNSYTDEVKAKTSSWHDNRYDAPDTNGSWDTRMEDLYEVANDLLKIGYIKPRFNLVPINHEYPNHAEHEFFVLIQGYKPNESSGPNQWCA